MARISAEREAGACSVTALDVFQYAGQQVRTIVIDGDPWFVGRDVAGILGYADTTNAIKQHCRGVVKHHPILDALGRTQNVRIISEPDMLRLIVNSKLPAAEQFERWVFEDVIPTIRKTGRYGSDVDMLTALPSAKLLRLAAEAAERAETLEAKVAADAPKVEAYDAFIDADGTYSVGAVAKMLGLSQNKLFDRLRNEGVLIAKGAMRNTPYQQYMHHFSVKAYEFERSNGERSTSYTTRVQSSGVDFLRRKLGLALAVA